jgi:hypothetical protein
MPHPATPSRFIGCDVGKTAIVVFDTVSGRTHAIANEPQALRCLARPDLLRRLRGPGRL